MWPVDHGELEVQAVPVFLREFLDLSVGDLDGVEARGKRSAVTRFRRFDGAAVERATHDGGEFCHGDDFLGERPRFRRRWVRRTGCGPQSHWPAHPRTAEGCRE